MKIPSDTYSETSLAAYFKVTRPVIRRMRERDLIDPELTSTSANGGLVLFDKGRVHDRVRRLADLYSRTPADKVDQLPKPLDVLLRPAEMARRFAPTTDQAELAKLAIPVDFSGVKI